MNIYQVRDSGIGSIQNTIYFWIVKTTLDGDTRDMSAILLVSNDFKFASYRGRSYRVCQLELEMDIDNDQPFIKVWENDPFTNVEGMPPLPPDDSPEYMI